MAGATVCWEVDAPGVVVVELADSWAMNDLTELTTAAGGAGMDVASEDGTKAMVSR